MGRLETRWQLAESGPALLLAAVVFGVHLVWVFQGIDLTDDGFHLARQVDLVRTGRVSGGGVLTFLSDLAGGLWLRLHPTPSLLWARLGGPLLSGVCAAVAFVVLSRSFPRPAAWAAVAASSVFIVSRSHHLIHYYTFPALLLAILVACAAALFATPPDSRAGVRAGLFLGGCCALLVLARFPLVVVPPAVAAVLLLAGPRQNSVLSRVRSVAVAGLGGGLVLGLFWTAMQLLGLWRGYEETLGSVLAGRLDSDPSYSLASLLGLTFDRGLKSVVGAAALLVGLVVIGVLGKRLGRVFGFVAMPGLALILLRVQTTGPIAARYRLVEVVAATVALVLMLIAVACWRDRREISGVALMALVTMAAIPLGSNTGLQTSVYGMWVGLPLAVLGCGSACREVWPRLASSMESLRGATLATLVLLGLFLPLCGVLYTPALRTSAYGLPDDRFKMTEQFRDPALRGIWAEAGVVQDVDEVLARVRAGAASGDTIQVAGRAPMIYYLTGTRRLLDLIFIERIPEADLAGICQREARVGRLAKLVVLPVADELDRSRAASILAHVFRDEMGYGQVWSNRRYVILARSPG